MKACAHPVCQNDAPHGRLCSGHRRRLKLGLDMDAPWRVTFKADPDARFLASIEYDANGGCWLWSACTKGNGYGQLRVGKINVAAHRFSYERHLGPIPAKTVVCHRCDVPVCVNPDHLFLGSIADNNADKGAKGRAPRGVQNFRAKLDDNRVRRIRRQLVAGDSSRSLAAEHGVSRAAIRMIKSGVSWAWLDRPAATPPKLYPDPTRRRESEPA